ncbi:iron chelate uptake ABC transporter family permease subunit [Streptomyces sp. WAC04114]|uniref:metal ABC transporter permease n=1 Tax=Streptomyces sp. WAC04114 TaxID=2867961 RepID=UPI0027E15C5B|nr:iron chelate uptake ABC transporter family permease subunit [Streptomyces sp. WAC04114]
MFAATIGVAVLIGVLGRRGRADDVAIGSALSWLLGLGAFFLTLYTTSRGAGHGTAGVSVLFGSIFGLSDGQAGVAVLVAACICAAVLLLARPLLFASLDEAVAAARGVPVRVLGIAFLVLVGACAAEATQAVGSLLLLGLLAAPAAPRTGSPHVRTAPCCCRPGSRSWRCGLASPSAGPCRPCRPASRSSRWPLLSTRVCSLSGDRVRVVLPR